MPTIKLTPANKTNPSGTVLKWLKKPGDSINKGDLLVELDTVIGPMQVESPLTGKLGQILAPVGKTVAAHGELAIVDSSVTPIEPVAKLATPTSNTASVPASTGQVGTVIPVLMPKAGQSMEEGTITKWHVQVGSIIKKGQVIFEIETDKANMDVEAADSGRLARIVVGDGGSLAVLQPVGFLADNDADVDAYLSANGGGQSTSAIAPTGTPAKTPASVQASVVPTRESAVASAAVTVAGRVKASPAARKLAGERGIDLGTVTQGTGPDGRILSTDVPVSSAPTTATRRRMSGMRKAIARNLLQSKQTIPHFYVRLTIDAGPLLAFYQSQKAQYPCSINDVIVMGCGKLIKEFPAFRSRIDGEEIVESPSANIGIAVGMDDGLVVPVLQGAERLSLKQIGSETKRLAASARSGKIEGMGIGSFTITNLGMFGTEEFAAIINPPEAAILAIGAAREAVVVKDGAMRAGKVMTMTISADHRVIDGMLAAKFLARLKELLESPEKLA